MLRTLATSAVLLLLLTLLVGGLYPLAVTGIAAAAFPGRAHGSLIEVDGRLVGSALLGQPFASPHYFWPRPSATARVAYDGAASAGSQLGPLDPALAARIAADVQRLRAAHGVQEGAGEQPPAGEPTEAPIPVDLLTASGSGLDPHISPAAARFQVPRVAAARGLDPALLGSLVEAHVEGRWLGILGEPRVSVLKLNLALDTLAARAR